MFNFVHTAGPYWPGGFFTARLFLPTVLLAYPAGFLTAETDFDFGEAVPLCCSDELIWLEPSWSYASLVSWGLAPLVLERFFLRLVDWLSFSSGSFGVIASFSTCMGTSYGFRPSEPLGLNATLLLPCVLLGTIGSAIYC